MKVKICGLTNLEDARFCAGAGADFIGFIQYPPSPRYVAPDVAREIIAWVYGPQAVGVFVDEDPETVNRIAEAATFDLVQLHGNESPDTCVRVERPVIKAFRPAPTETTDALRARMERYRAHVDYYLLDASHPTLWGGTGHVLDWQRLRPLSDDFPILLGGGLSADNVEEAGRLMHPWAVDLSSSVEAAPGKKDFDKLTTFFDTFNPLRTPLSEEPD